MSAPAGDTIAAIATPPGRGGVGIVRISGPGAAGIARSALGRVPEPRMATLATFRDPQGQPVDQGLALFFPGPRSYTGEDLLEFQGHGGPVVMDRVLTACLGHGCRLARPGEFTQRAFLNDRMDLAQAEAVADLIDAGSAAAARGALRTLEGALSRRTEALAEALTVLRSHVEAALDFPEEELDLLADTAVGDRLEHLREELQQLLEGAGQGRLLQEGAHLVIAGRPNAGKSSLLNRLADRETAIVTAIPGTTRDVLREHLSLDGLPLHLVDTAGLHASEDPVEQEGMRRAWTEMERADVILLVVDATAGEGEAEAAIRARLDPALPVITLLNKIDRLPDPPREYGEDRIPISALTGEGMDRLKARIRDLLHYHGKEEGLFTARRRHLDALERMQTHLEAARGHLQAGVAPELLAEELRLAQEALGEITGRVTNEDLLGRIFADFCIGK
ncbi:tRNA modification GTPase trmE [Ectothiorhodospira mobilis]|uniref:tRNA modification GTPase MnmE n=1 Tax=Ectothiorhodospira mobilis TaxID=195064 RepID=A0A1I4R0J6_ECTMO|nr:tRNA uridine-5-carboxymethylaminomethyl(34) synthesis GTPase MnmE [Ectothiorhodospira mobilis]SFM45470.1 tRNA modification GTPase trmE [Ectothiorhodospira mobilis]